LTVSHNVIKVKGGVAWLSKVRAVRCVLEERKLFQTINGHNPRSRNESFMCGVYVKSSWPFLFGGTRTALFSGKRTGTFVVLDFVIKHWVWYRSTSEIAVVKEELRVIENHHGSVKF